MIYYLRAWVNDGAITLLETDTNPITENHAPDEPFDILIDAILELDEPVTGCDLLAQMSVVNGQIFGVEFESQWVSETSNT